VIEWPTDSSQASCFGVIAANDAVYSISLPYSRDLALDDNVFVSPPS